MSHEIEAFFVGIIFMGVIWLVADWTLDPMDRAYKRGHIDALTGKICYQLVTNADKTKHWEEIEPCADHRNSDS